jgi:hypothetical protein
MKIPNYQTLLGLSPQDFNVAATLTPIPACDPKKCPAAPSGNQTLSQISSTISILKSGQKSEQSLDSSTWVALPTTTPQIYMNQDDFVRLNDLLATAQYEIAAQVITYINKATDAEKAKLGSTTIKTMTDTASAWEAQSTQYFNGGFAVTAGATATTPDLTDSKNGVATPETPAVKDELRKKRDVPQEYGRAVNVVSGALSGCGGTALAVFSAKLFTDAAFNSTSVTWGQKLVEAGFSCVTGALVGGLAGAFPNGLRPVVQTIFTAVANRWSSGAVAPATGVAVGTQTGGAQTGGGYLCWRLACKCSCPIDLNLATPSSS